MNTLTFQCVWLFIVILGGFVLSYSPFIFHELFAHKRSAVCMEFTVINKWLRSFSADIREEHVEHQMWLGLVDLVDFIEM